MICRRKYSASIAIGIASLLFIFLISLNTWEKLGLPNSLHKTYEARAELLTLLAAGCVVLAFITDRYSDKYHSKPALILTGTVGFAAALHFLTATDYFILALVLLPMFAAGIMITSPLPCPKSSEDRLTWVFCIIGLLGLSLLSLTTSTAAELLFEDLGKTRYVMTVYASTYFVFLAWFSVQVYCVWNVSRNWLKRRICFLHWHDGLIQCTRRLMRTLSRCSNSSQP